MMIRGYAVSARLIAGLVAIGLVVLLLLWGPAACRALQSERAQSRVDRGQAGAAEASGTDAIGTVSNRASSDAASEDLTRDNARDIRAASDARTRSPATDLAGRRAICKRPSYIDRPECRMFKEPNQ